ncbi:MAG: hypothetical protein SVM80_06865 [Halobacteriota archaeon]|nr:hypothetical protein [Halobacteriota archaeon]
MYKTRSNRNLSVIVAVLVVIVLFFTGGCIKEDPCKTSTPFEFEESRGVAVDEEGNIYNVAYGKIQKFKKCNSVYVLLWEKNYMSDDVDVVIDKEYVWLVSRSHNAIGKFLTNGDFVSFSVNDIDSPTGIDYKANYIYVTEFHNKVKKYDAKNGGDPILTISLPPAPGYSPDVNPQDVAVDTTGNIYVLIAFLEPGPNEVFRVLKYDKEGTLVDEEFISDLIRSESIVVDSNDDIIVSDYSGRDSKVIDMIKKYSMKGELMASYIVPEAEYISGIAVDDSGEIYISDAYAKTIFSLER